MRVVGVTEFGGPEALHIVELPDPEVGSGQLRIRVHGAAVNPTDTLLRSGARAEMLRDVPPPLCAGHGRGWCAGTDRRWRLDGTCRWATT